MLLKVCCLEIIVGLLGSSEVLCPRGNPEGRRQSVFRNSCYEIDFLSFKRGHVGIHAQIPMLPPRLWSPLESVRMRGPGDPPPSPWSPSPGSSGQWSCLSMPGFRLSTSTEVSALIMQGRPQLSPQEPPSEHTDPPTARTDLLQTAPCWHEAPTMDTAT